MSTQSEDREKCVQEFIVRINAHDARGIAALCTPAHSFIDSLGNRLTDLARLESGWAAYFALFPDYRIEVEKLAVRGDLVLLSGFAAATRARTGLSWRIPAARAREARAAAVVSVPPADREASARMRQNLAFSSRQPER